MRLFLVFFGICDFQNIESTGRASEKFQVWVFQNEIRAGKFNKFGKFQIWVFQNEFRAGELGSFKYGFPKCIQGREVGKITFVLY